MLFFVFVFCSVFFFENSGGSKGRQECAPSLGPISFHFDVVFAKIWVNAHPGVGTTPSTPKVFSFYINKESWCSFRVGLLLTLSLLHFFCYLHLVLICMDGGLIHLVIGKLSFKIKSLFFVINTQIVDHHIKSN